MRKTIVHEERPFFKDRVEAGRLLAEKLEQHRGKSTVVYAIPRGGVPVAVEVALALSSPLDLVIVRKIPVPQNPESGYGAVTEDGAVVLNEQYVKDLGLNRMEIAKQAEEVRFEIKRRSEVFRQKLSPVPDVGKTVILIDDGLASGYTMLAALKSLRQRSAGKLVVAVPVASESAYDLVKPAADELVFLVLARVHWFAVASYYYNWYDLTDEEVVKYIDEWKDRQISEKI